MNKWQQLRVAQPKTITTHSEKGDTHIHDMATMSATIDIEPIKYD